MSAARYLRWEEMMRRRLELRPWRTVVTAAGHGDGLVVAVAGNYATVEWSARGWTRCMTTSELTIVEQLDGDMKV